MASEIEYEEKDVYIYLDFAKEIDDNIFDNEFFFRIANLDTPTPLVQLNESLFKGTYNNALGTNLFFEECKHPREKSLYEKQAPLSLQHKVSQNKILTLTPVKIPSKSKDIPAPASAVKISKKYDYDTLLKKLKNRSLNFEEMLAEDAAELENTPTVEKTLKKLDSKSKMLKNIEITEPVTLSAKDDDVEETLEKDVDIIKFKYEKLKRLARIPTKHVAEENCALDTEINKSKYELNCLKSQILKPSAAFLEEIKGINTETLEGTVDVSSSVLNGVIEPSSELYRKLTDSEKSKLLTMENMQNLSLSARYWVCLSQLQYIETKIINSSEDELQEKDQYGRTLQETATIYKELLSTLSFKINGPSKDISLIKVRNLDIEK